MMHFKEPMNGLTHFIGAVLASICLVWLVTVTWGDLPKLITTSIFGISMILLYGASTAMHWYNGSEQVNRFLQKLDHAAIYLLIAGSYTPFTYFLLDGWWRIGLLSVVWGIALGGAISKLFFFWEGHLSTLFYVLMGCAIVPLAPKLLPIVPMGLVVLLAVGGVIYMFGAVIFALKMPNFHRHFGHHELWHVFVLGGNLVHVVALIRYIL